MNYKGSREDNGRRMSLYGRPVEVVAYANLTTADTRVFETTTADQPLPSFSMHLWFHPKELGTMTRRPSRLLGRSGDVFDGGREGMRSRVELRAFKSE